jgi:hypothetical protein
MTQMTQNDAKRRERGKKVSTIEISKVILLQMSILGLIKSVGC